MKPTIEQFRAWGGMTAGTDLDQSQIDQINAITGVDVTDSLLAEGYYVYIGPFTPAMRCRAYQANGLLLVHRRRDHPGYHR